MQWTLYLSAVVWLFIFIGCIGLMVYSYVLYPLLMLRLSRNKHLDKPKLDNPPMVSVITAVYNEENVLNEKIQTLRDLDYPKHKLHIYFGSDNSTDRSNQMLSQFAEEQDNVTFIPFKKRQGKIGIINKLGIMALEEHGQKSDHILFYNDANVMLTPEIMRTMMRHFNDASIALVDANMKSRRTKREGISLAEKAYISSEVLLKHHEGKAWGMLQGAFGGCYGLRSTFHTLVPDGFLVDDFFITFQAMTKGGKAINDLDAHCFESASHDIWQEYGRKARISAGNFQNLNYFLERYKSISWRLWFCFFSHKIIRWFGPLLLVLIIISAVGWHLHVNDLGSLSILLMTLGVLVGVPLLDFALLTLGIHLDVLRKVRYFVLMNIALFKGFIRYAKGIRTSFWDPPKRV